MTTPGQRSWLDAWWSRFLLAPAIVAAGVLFVVVSVDGAHPRSVGR